MSDLTETEIFDCMRDSLRSAIDECDQIAIKPLKGKIYNEFRKHIALAEGCCRQAGHWREDTRWFQWGVLLEECHKRAGDWLRGIKVRDEATGREHYRPIPEGQKHPLFVMLADNLRAMHAKLVEMETARTGRSGAIMPVPLEGAHRQIKDNYALGLPAGMHRTSSGLIIDGTATQ